MSDCVSSFYIDYFKMRINNLTLRTQLVEHKHIYKCYVFLQSSSNVLSISFLTVLFLVVVVLYCFVLFCFKCFVFQEEQGICQRWMLHDRSRHVPASNRPVAVALREAVGAPVSSGYFFMRALIHGGVFHSKSYGRVNQRNSYTIKLKEEGRVSYGQIQCFVKVRKGCCQYSVTAICSWSSWI